MNKGVVFVSGIFNVLHPGHLRLLKYARDLGDRLVVGVLSDSIAGPDAHIPEQLRLEALQLNELVDEAFLVEKSPEKEIERLKPAFVVKGREHSLRHNPELSVVQKYGGRLLFSSGDVTFTSRDLIRREFEGLDARNMSIPAAFMARHGISLARLRELILGFSRLNIVVLGDTIVDEYITCEPLGMSEEDPTVVVAPISSDRFIGGAAVVAAHAARLGAKVTFVSVIGDDPAGKYVTDELKRIGVEADFILDDSRPTTLKQRFRAHNKTLLRVSKLSQRTIDTNFQSQIIATARRSVNTSDALIFSDFNYGVLPQSIVNQISALSREVGIITAADSQSSSQLGDISRYSGMNLISATERETRLALRNNDDGINTVATALLEKTSARNLLLKLGADGALLLRRLDEPGRYEIEQLPALNPNPRDVAGAGDSMLVVTSMALAAEANLWEAALLGSLAAAVQVSRVGNIPLEPHDLLRELEA